MTTESIPRPLVVLREEFQAMSESLNSRMGTKPLRSGREVDILDLSGEHILKLSDHVHVFCEQISDGLDTITYEPDSYLRRIVSLLCKELNGMLNGYDEVRCLTPHPDDFEGWKLLVGIYEDTLLQIRNWLSDVLAFLNNPVAGVQERQNSTDEDGLVTLYLEMKAPKPMYDFINWLERIRDEISLIHDDDLTVEQNRQRIGSTELIMGTLIGLTVDWG